MVATIHAITAKILQKHCDVMIWGHFPLYLLFVTEYNRFSIKTLYLLFVTEYNRFSIKTCAIII